MGNGSRGATVLPDGGVEFRVWAPRQARMAVRTRRKSVWEEHPMTRTGEEHVARVPRAGAGTRYAYVLADGRVWPDPVSRWQPDGVHEASAVVRPDEFTWTDDAWRGMELADLVIYELHVGTYSRRRTFQGVAEDLDRLRQLGVTAIELMPVAALPGSRNWGYDGVALYAVHEAYGGPDGLRRLVDAAHNAELAVIMDVVYNHLGPEGNYLDDFGPYFTDVYHTPWGRAVNYDQAGCDDVRRFVVDNARMWIEEYHCDGLRLDAVHAIYDLGARHILREISDAVHAAGESHGRRTIVIAESDQNDPRIVRQDEREGFGCDGQWADDFHHAVHAELTGERAGYYSDFGGVDMIAEAIRQPFVYRGQRSAYRGRRHGAPADGESRERFVVCIQNHDQVGNRAAGDRLDALVSPAQRRLAAALLLLSPYVPLLFMGEEYGERRPFQYFVSHTDPELVRAVRDGRRNEFASFGWQDDVPDPQSEETFERSTLDASVATTGDHARILDLYTRLLAMRHSEPSLRPGTASVEVEKETGEDWIRVRLTSNEGRPLVGVFNFSAEQRAVPIGGGAWLSLLGTDDVAFGGNGAVARLSSTDGVASASVAAHSAELFAERT